jgi:hypothetical protein
MHETERRWRPVIGEEEATILMGQDRTNDLRRP